MLNIMKKIITLICITIVIQNTFAQKLDASKQYVMVPIAFYNVENLYDTLNDPQTKDDEFTPEGLNRFNGERYRFKINHMAEVMSQLGTEYNPDGAAVIGMCEVENPTPMKDLANSPQLKKRKYESVLFDSRYTRGVDVCLMYQPKYFKMTNSVSYMLICPWDSSFNTRDQLLVSGLLLGEPVHFIVNHWPSRRGGEERSAPFRVLAAQLSKHIIDSISKADPTAKVIHMGDLNDDPTNESTKNVMRGKRNMEEVKEGDLYNTMYDKFKKGIGTLAHQDTWGLFDQIMITPNLIPVKDDFTTFKFFKSVVFNKSFLQQPDGRFKGYPFRTYIGSNFTGGYSDHFPVYIILAKELKK